MLHEIGIQFRGVISAYPRIRESTYPSNLGYSFKVAGYSAVKPRMQLAVEGSVWGIINVYYADSRNLHTSEAFEEIMILQWTSLFQDSGSLYTRV